jgi:hypothetical protein
MLYAKLPGVGAICAGVLPVGDILGGILGILAVFLNDA